MVPQTISAVIFAPTILARIYFATFREFGDAFGDAWLRII